MKTEFIVSKLDDLVNRTCDLVDQFASAADLD